MSDPVAARRLDDRLGASLQRTPYVWLAVTILLLVLLSVPLPSVSKDSEDASTALTVALTVLIAASALAAILFPRVVMPKARRPMPPERLALTTWSFAVAPFLYGFCGLFLGVGPWVYALGFATTAVLLVVAARRAAARRESDTAPGAWRNQATADNYRTDANLKARMGLFDFLVESPSPPPPTDQFTWEPGARVLDVGCGNGFWLGAVKPTGARAIGLDLSPGMLAAARTTHADVPFVQATATDLPFASASFDAVLALWMLYHVEDKQRALTEFRRVLVPTGRLIACTNDNSPARVDELVCDAVAEVTGTRPERWAPSLDFNAENGARILGTVFDDVEERRFRNRFEVTEPEVVVDSVGSMRNVMETLTPGLDVDAVLDALRRRANDEIAARGHVEIIQERACFVAR